MTSVHKDFQPRADAKPTAKQVYMLARQLTELTGMDWPKSRLDASNAIKRLQAQQLAVACRQAEGEPF